MHIIKVRISASGYLPTRSSLCSAITLGDFQLFFYNNSDDGKISSWFWLKTSRRRIAGFIAW